ncbi:MAG: HAD family hydrolase [Candidatus Omnitrophica bacterium]|nr:HAD family hydrolase [Candidatus Omnitrophota bacterium]
MKKIIFIDRDGVVNVDLMDYVTKWEDFQFEEGAIEALQLISRMGLEIIMISNQAGVGDGLFSEDILWEIHHKMLAELKRHGVSIRDAMYCIHGKDEKCKCRKPEVGLLEEAVKDIQYDPQKTYMIGDKVSDILAGKRFGLKTILVRTGYGRRDETRLTEESRPDAVCDNLRSAVEILKKGIR